MLPKVTELLIKDHVTNENVRRKIKAAVGKYDEFVTLVSKRKLRWFGHVSRSSALQIQGKRRKDGQKKRWVVNIKEWTGMDFASSTRAVEDKTRWKRIVVKSYVVPHI